MQGKKAEKAEKSKKGNKGVTLNALLALNTL